LNWKILLRLPIVQEVQTGAKQTKYKVKKQQHTSQWPYEESKAKATNTPRGATHRPHEAPLFSLLFGFIFSNSHNLAVFLYHFREILHEAKHRTVI
jgi:hypothetical protein